MASPDVVLALQAQTDLLKNEVHFLSLGHGTKSLLWECTHGGRVHPVRLKGTMASWTGVKYACLVKMAKGRGPAETRLICV